MVHGIQYVVYDMQVSVFYTIGVLESRSGSSTFWIPRSIWEGISWHTVWWAVKGVLTLAAPVSLGQYYLVSPKDINPR